MSNIWQITSRHHKHSWAERIKLFLREMKEIELNYGALVAPGQAQSILGVSKQGLYDIINSGALTPVKYRGRVFLTEKNLLKYMENRLSKATMHDLMVNMVADGVD